MGIPCFRFFSKKFEDFLPASTATVSQPCDVIKSLKPANPIVGLIMEGLHSPIRWNGNTP